MSHEQDKLITTRMIEVKIMAKAVLKLQVVELKYKINETMYSFEG